MKNNRQQGRSNAQDERLCFHCKQPGHLKKDCPEPPYCSKCRTKGHIPAKCPAKNQNSGLNSKVNKWAMELEAFNIQFDYIKGQNNILTDMLSHLVDIDPDTPLTPEGQGYEFGYAVFEEFPKVKTKTYEVNEVIVGTDKKIKSDPDLRDTLQCINNPIAPEWLKCQQQQDANIETLKHK